MSQQQQMAMGQMGGPVGGGPVAQPANAGTPTNSGVPITPQEVLKNLNTAIYDYLLCHEKYDAARAIRDCLSIEVADHVKQSPGQRGNQPNGVDMDVDSKDHVGIKNRPSDLPMPKTLSSEESPFLQDWWCQFWELYQGNRQRGKQTTISYVGQQRIAQKQRTGMLGGVDPNGQRGFNMMNANGQMNMNDLRQAALKNGMNPQQQAQLANMRKVQGAQGNMQGAQMERQGSQMDMNGPRTGSPNTGGDAPSPKRQRLDGSNMAQMNQARPGQMQGGNQVGPPSINVPTHTLELLRQRGLDPGDMSQEQLQRMSAQPTNVQAKSVEVYSAAIQQQMQAAMQRTNSNANKGMPPTPAMGPGGAQSSPMNQQGMDGNTGEFYQGRMSMPQNGAAVTTAPAQGQNNGGNHALQDYQMQLMLLEQQNKKRLLMARQEQDSMAHPTGVPGPNGGQFPAGMSPQGNRAGDPSPNPNDMQRGTPNMNKKAGMSPNGDITGRGSPQPGMMDPNMNPQMRGQMMGPNGQMMRPPSSHPMGQMTPQQMEMMRNQSMMPNGNWQQGGPQPPPGQMMPGQQPGQQPGQPPNVTRQSTMPPPPAPATNPGGTQPSSPATQPAPPTPQTNAKAKGGNKKEAAGKKNAASKKAAANVANEDSNQPPTPTPPPAMTPSNQASFKQNQNLQMPNGQPAPVQQPGSGAPGPQPTAPPVQQPMPDMNAQPFGALGDDQNFGISEFSDLNSGDVLDNFDFDSFLNSNGGGDDFGFDASLNFGDGTDGIEMGN